MLNQGRTQNIRNQMKKTEKRIVFTSPLHSPDEETITKIFIEVSKGSITSVRSSTPRVRVVIIDNDEGERDEEVGRYIACLKSSRDYIESTTCLQ